MNPCFGLASGRQPHYLQYQPSQPARPIQPQQARAILCSPVHKPTIAPIAITTADTSNCCPPHALDLQLLLRFSSPLFTSRGALLLDHVASHLELSCAVTRLGFRIEYTACAGPATLLSFHQSLLRAHDATALLDCARVVERVVSNYLRAERLELAFLEGGFLPKRQISDDHPRCWTLHNTPNLETHLPRRPIFAHRLP